MKKIFLLLLLVIACKKDDKVYDDPYAGGKKPLGVTMSTDLPTPSEAAPGVTIRFKGKGMLKHKDSIHFNFNGEPGEILAIDSTGVEVKVPETASTGVTSVTIGDQIFFGPVFKVKGNLEVDNNFKVVIGANGAVLDVHRFSDGRLLMIGQFSDYEHKGVVKPINRIVMTSKDGEIDRTLLSGRGADGALVTMDALPNGKLVAGGNFTSYDIHLAEIHNITVLNSNGSIDSMTVNTFLKKDTVPAFNGGTDGTVNKVFVHNNMITAIGNFNYYLQYVYGESDFRHERDSLITDSVVVRQLIRFYPNGSLDSSFNYDLSKHKSYDGANGPINDAFMQADGKIIIVGRFTRYNGLPASNIARINTDGSLDPGFGGAGADNAINTIRYNETTQKFMLAGSFTKFDGASHHGLAMLKADGTTDEQFSSLQMGTNEVFYCAQQLSNGLIIVTGNFKSYGNVHRSGLMVLDNKGALAAGYNNTGDLEGGVAKIFETTNSSGQTQALLLGYFYRFNQIDVGNITRLLFK
ncbi:protein of unknown function [Chitinophaga sp. CF118]|uniref:DUF5008 domain-containing protein n=1 Tax=Chitinophaga sp. CF118 TaxID=1884367 RepID=UPI0008F2A9F0|nr:DUF5008 domain-containing protein [Chitinophaga sp. CF118]SFE17434.1 protein of unknown function [Chitinophaga sp. CF118]